MKMRQGFSDSSGRDHLRVGGESVAVLRWGCGCCKNDSPLTKKEQKFADNVVKRWNGYNELVKEVKRLNDKLELLED